MAEVFNFNCESYISLSEQPHYLIKMNLDHLICNQSIIALQTFSLAVIKSQATASTDYTAPLYFQALYYGCQQPQQQLQLHWRLLQMSVQPGVGQETGNEVQLGHCKHFSGIGLQLLRREINKYA